MRSEHVLVTIDLERVRAAAENIKARTRVPLIAVVKSDAYGLGAVRVTDALAAVADDFAYFDLREARAVGRPGLVLGPPQGEPDDHRELGLRPTIGNRAEASRYAGVPVAVELDSGMQRFGCAPDELDDLVRRCRSDEIYTHTCGLRGAEILRAVASGRGRLHAASTSLLDEPRAWLDSVRPGLALYRDALRVTAPLVTVRETSESIGYTGFAAPRVGVILAGYSHGVRPGPVLISGREQQVLEVGMNTSFVSVDRADRVGDEVLLVGRELPPAVLAKHFHCREHEILCRYCGMGRRRYRTSRRTVRPLSRLVAPAAGTTQLSAGDLPRA